MNVEELEELERTARNAERDADNLVAAVDMLSDAAFFEDALRNRRRLGRSGCP